jgi:predicted metal-dependent peptidase
VAPFKELDKHACDVAVVLTDGYGTFPVQVKTPASKIIWAMTSNVVAPFGKTIKLQKY